MIKLTDHLKKEKQVPTVVDPAGIEERKILRRLECRMRSASLLIALAITGLALPPYIFVGILCLLVLLGMGLWGMMALIIPPLLIIATLLAFALLLGFWLLSWCIFIRLQCHNNFDLKSDLQGRAAEPNHIRMVHFVNGWPIGQQDWDITLPSLPEHQHQPGNIKPNEAFIGYDYQGNRAFYLFGSEDRLFPPFWGQAKIALTDICHKLRKPPRPVK